FFVTKLGAGLKPQLLISPTVAEKIAQEGYSKKAVKQSLFEKAKFPIERYLRLFPGDVESDFVKQLQESADSDGLVPLVSSPEDFMITISGDMDRDNCYICGQNGFIGYPVSKKV